MTFPIRIRRYAVTAACLTLVPLGRLAAAQGTAPAQGGTTKMFHLANVGSESEANEIATALRNALDANDRQTIL